jgi:hypothetical protein
MLEADELAAIVRKQFIQEGLCTMNDYDREAIRPKIYDAEQYDVERTAHA